MNRTKMKTFHSNLIRRLVCFLLVALTLVGSTIATGGPGLLGTAAYAAGTSWQIDAPSTVTVVRGETTSVVIRFKGEGISSYAGSLSGSDIVGASFSGANWQPAGQWCSTTLNLTGKKSGTAEVTFKLNGTTTVQKSIKVTVVEPSASTLKIGSGKYSPGTLTAGNSYSFSGTVTSNYKITSVTVGVYDANGKAVQTKTASPNAYSYDINKLDSYIKFGSLSGSSGGTTYYFRVSATDTKQTKQLVNSKFTVKVNSNITISSGNYTPGTLNEGQTYSISGTINSTQKLKSVTVGIYTASGSATSSVRTVNPNSNSYNIHNLDSYIKFGTLSGTASGTTYYFKVIATDAAGTTKTLVNSKFTIKKQSVPSSYKTMAEATFEVQTGSGCVLTSYSMLVKSKLYIEGKSYNHINQSTIKSYNNGNADAYWDLINSNIAKKAGTTGTLSADVRKTYSSASNKTYIINLLKTRPEGVLVYFHKDGNNQHAVLFRYYDSASDTFYVSDPGKSSSAYITLQASRIGNGTYSWGTNLNTAFSYVNRVVYYK